MSASAPPATSPERICPFCKSTRVHQYVDQCNGPTSSYMCRECGCTRVGWPTVPEDEIKLEAIVAGKDVQRQRTTDTQRERVAALEGVLKTIKTELVLLRGVAPPDVQGHLSIMIDGIREALAAHRDHGERR